MIKKRQYHIWQFKLEDLVEKDGNLQVEIDIEDAVLSNETLMYYILNEKIMNKKYNNKIKGANYLPLITIETGRSRTKENTAKFKKLLSEGFIVQDGRRFVFVDNVLSSSQNKECRQIYVLEKYLAKLKQHISLGMEPEICTISKNLTRNALTTTDVHLIPVDMKQLGICIISDCEVPVYEDVTMIKPYIRTSEEEKLYEELNSWIEADKAYYKKMKEVSEAVNSDDCCIEKKSKENRQKETYKTVNQWKEAGRKVKAEKLENPKARTYVDTKSKYYALYVEEQTEEIGVVPAKLTPPAKWMDNKW